MEAQSQFMASGYQTQGLTYPGAVSQHLPCSACAQPVRLTARFCGSCGTATRAAAAVPELAPAHSAPAFAHVQAHTVPKELHEELGHLLLLLVRERFFLYSQCLIFLAINIFGFWFSMKAYNEFNCDEMTKGIIALTPLLFINAIGLAILAPINGTRREIARLKERITYTRYRIEYHGII